MVGCRFVVLFIVRWVAHNDDQLRHEEPVLLATYRSPRPDKNREHLHADSEMYVSKCPIKAGGVMIAESDSRFTTYPLCT